MYAPELYALANGIVCKGTEECHYCGGPCGRDYGHDDPPPVPFIRTVHCARRPANPWTCKGCWLLHLKRVTVNFLGNGFKDRQCPVKHSLFITTAGAWALSDESVQPLYRHLLKPPLTFALALLSDDFNNPNHLQFCPVNEFSEVRADTPLQFTLNNAVHTYTVYELEVAVREGLEGTEPGVQALVRRLGACTVLPQKGDEKRSRGRPFKEESPPRPNRRVTI